MRTNRYLACVLVLAMGAWGCDNNDDPDAGPSGTDAGPGPTDGGGTDAGPGMTDGGGTDAGGTDAGGTDAGMPANFEIRLVNNMPGLTGSTAVPGGTHVCIYIASPAGMIVGMPRRA